MYLYKNLNNKYDKILKCKQKVQINLYFFLKKMKRNDMIFDIFS